MANYLVTGCAGFIGWKVCEFLLAGSSTLVGVDNLNDAYDPRLKHWRLGQIKDHPSFAFHRLDIRDRESLRGLFEEMAVGDSWAAVVNLAARAGVRQSVENPWGYFETNVTGILNLLELCQEFGVQKFVQASTSSLYGANNPRPFREDAYTDGPLSPYAASKKAAEALCYTYHYLYDIDMTVLRYFTVYGPAGRPDMSLFRFVQWINEGRPVIVYGDGQQSRDFTYVDDIARGTLAALKPMRFDPSTKPVLSLSKGSGRCEAQQSGHEVINLGSDEPVVINDAIRLVEELVGKKASIEHRPRHPADVMATWADIGKAKRLLNWRPQTQFRQGVARLAAWYQDNREWARDVVTT